MGLSPKLGGGEVGIPKWVIVPSFPFKRLPKGSTINMHTFSSLSKTMIKTPFYLALVWIVMDPSL